MRSSSTMIEELEVSLFIKGSVTEYFTGVTSLISELTQNRAKDALTSGVANEVPIRSVYSLNRGKFLCKSAGAQMRTHVLRIRD